MQPVLEELRTAAHLNFEILTHDLHQARKIGSIRGRDDKSGEVKVIDELRELARCCQACAVNAWQVHHVGQGVWGRRCGRAWHIG